ncbi:hypothetical protein OSB04_025957 [Centaurea solstitialis]|uniref:F-box domain-containing protein n=1 Tax=Centaurea solstitialis TaxID=347529 RepID=A0AA38T1B6_9ASTR|nr:hypothetical protein OSB04_025957 [Centaurea solstitialis]
MVNTRAKTKRITNTLQLRRISEDSLADHHPIVSATLVASNDQLITKILIRLPVTSLLRFKLVSKHWNSLLTHPRFTLLYDRLLPTPGLFLDNLYIPFELDQQKPTTPPFRSLDFYLDPYGIKIVQSCNGLLLCCSRQGHVRARKYYVFNPTTKKFVVVPSVPGGTNVRKNIRFMGLAFHQTDCPRFKLLCVHHHQDLFQIQIYSSETRKWNISGQTLSDAHLWPYFIGGVYWNKAILWPPSCMNPTYFKLDDGVQQLPLPEEHVTSSYQHGAVPLYFGECGGHLHLVERRHGEIFPLHLNVYEMMSDHSGWFIKYQVELDELPIAYPEMISRYRDPSSPYYYDFKVLDVVRRRGEEEEEEGALAFMVVCIPGKMISFHGNLVIFLNTHLFFFFFNGTPPKMVNTRAKTKRLTNTLQLLRKDSMGDHDHHQPTVSATLVASNDDLLTQILLRLPVTSILRFKSVSKHWNSLLTHPHFTLLYDRLPPTPGFFLRNFYIPFQCNEQNPSPTPPFPSLDFYPDLRGIRILQSSNGLLLCCSDRGHVRARKYYVFNPTTNQFTVVPSVPGGMEVRKTIRFMGLAFHKTDCPHYKLLCILRAKPLEDMFQIQIYSSEAGKWKISDQTFSAPYYTIFTAGAYCNQAIHWAPSCIHPSYFRLDVQQVQKLPMPVQVASYQQGAVPLYFGECGGHLHLVERCQAEIPLHLNVYEMMSDHSGWFIKYQVELDELVIAYPEMISSYRDPSSPYYYDFKVLDVVRRGEEESFMVVCTPGKMIRFDLMDKSFSQIYDLNLSNVYYPSVGGYDLQVHRYIQAISSFY